MLSMLLPFRPCILKIVQDQGGAASGQQSILVMRCWGCIGPGDCGVEPWGVALVDVSADVGGFSGVVVVVSVVDLLDRVLAGRAGSRGLVLGG